MIIPLCRMKTYVVVCLNRCGGCGSKVGAQVLSTALRRVKKLMAHNRSEVITGLGDDAALVLPPAPPAYLVHSIDYFRSFISDPYLMGQIAVNHALSGTVSYNCGFAYLMRTSIIYKAAFRHSFIMVLKV